MKHMRLFVLAFIVVLSFSVFINFKANSLISFVLSSLWTALVFLVPITIACSAIIQFLNKKFLAGGFLLVLTLFVGLVALPFALVGIGLPLCTDTESKLLWYTTPFSTQCQYVNAGSCGIHTDDIPWYGTEGCSAEEKEKILLEEKDTIRLKGVGDRTINAYCNSYRFWSPEDTDRRQQIKDLFFLKWGVPIETFCET